MGQYYLGDIINVLLLTLSVFLRPHFCRKTCIVIDFRRVAIPRLNLINLQEERTAQGFKMPNW